jgi:NAD(P)-dependent dehydrogenase (short-subunit alcohol dehydrogenase family)
VPTAILTGAGGGWGGAVLDGFLDAGWDVVAPHRGGGVPRAGERVLAVEADVADPDAAERVVAAALERFGSVDALANIAGGFKASGALHETSIESWRGLMHVNLETAYAMTRAALRPMLAAGRGSIVFVTTRGALRPFPGAAAYLVSKAAVIALMQVVDTEVRKAGVRANAIVPNVVDTPQNRAQMPDADHSRWVTGEELARVVVWLCSDDSAPLSGGTIPAYGRG